ncbi:unnamed protein product [Staurois parvus]|uniref:Uncharacterized protein n=1 Tax=Staurois parvus TaxID=386267 RepID=A0ABN9H0B9_9NEOB|nr:unnamed protein product [Staurois parvus]
MIEAVKDRLAVASSDPQAGIPLGAESKPQSAVSPEPLMVGMDLKQPETRSRTPSSTSCGRGGFASGR